MRLGENRKMNIAVRSDVELREAVQQIGYELTQLCDAHVEMHRHDGGHIPVACMESAVIHARSLIEFFENKRKKADDIVPADFLDDWAVPTSESWGRLCDFVPITHKHLMHLTWERVGNSTTTSYHIDRMAFDVVAIMKVFLAALKQHDSPAFGDLELAMQVAQASLAKAERSDLTAPADS